MLGWTTFGHSIVLIVHIRHRTLQHTHLSISPSISFSVTLFNKRFPVYLFQLRKSLSFMELIFTKHNLKSVLLYTYIFRNIINTYIREVERNDFARIHQVCIVLRDVSFYGCHAFLVCVLTHNTCHMQSWIVDTERYSLLRNFIVIVI